MKARAVLWVRAAALRQRLANALLVEARPPRQPGAAPGEGEFGLLRAYLEAQGASPTEIDQAIGREPLGRSRAQIAEALRAWLARRAKGAQSRGAKEP